jgi:predicted small secreted protein
MKKILVLIAVLLFAVVFMGCDTGTNPGTSLDIENPIDNPIDNPGNGGDDTENPGNGKSTFVSWPAELLNTKWKRDEDTLRFYKSNREDLVQWDNGISKPIYKLESIENGVYHLFLSERGGYESANYRFEIQSDNTLTVTKVSGDNWNIPTGSGFIKQAQP